MPDTREKAGHHLQLMFGHKLLQGLHPMHVWLVLLMSIVINHTWHTVHRVTSRKEAAHDIVIIINIICFDKNNTFSEDRIVW